MKYRIPRPRQEDRDFLQLVVCNDNLFTRTVRTNTRGLLYEYICWLCGYRIPLAQKSSRRSCDAWNRRLDAHTLHHVNQIPEPTRKIALAAAALGTDLAVVREQVLGFATVNEAVEFFKAGKAFR